MATITSIKQRILQLDAGSFQILCDAYLSREGYHNIVSLGTRTGSQKTTQGTPDTYFCENDGKYVLVEYTTQQTNLEKKVREDLNKCFDKSYTGLNIDDILEIIYCYASSNLIPGADKSLKQLCLDNGIQLVLIGIDQLSEDLYRRYPVLAKEHLNLTIDTEQIQSPEDYVETYDANKLAAPLQTRFFFREKELEKLKLAVSEEDVILITGAAGTGKTRIALQFAAQYAKEIGAVSYVIHDRGLRLFQDLKLYFETPGNYVIVIDDANQLSELGLIIDYVNKRDQGYSVIILITVRNYAIQKVKGEIIGKAHFKTVEIPLFTDEEIESLVRELFGIINPDYLERINFIAQGNPRIAMIAGRLACDANRLSAIQDVTGLYEEYYGSAFREANLENNMQLQVVAGIIAFLNSVHMDHMAPVLPLLSEQGVDQIAFRRCVQMLNELELVDVCQDTAVAISDQCFANYILKHVFVDTQAISIAELLNACFEPYRERSIQAVNTLIGVFQNKGVHDHVSRQIKLVWEKRKAKGGDQYWDWVKAFYPINQEEALLLISERINNSKSVIIKPHDIDVESGKNYESVDDDIIRILGGYVYSDNYEAALDLFFEYYEKRPDLFIQFYHAINLYYGVKRESSRTGFIAQIHLIQHFAKYSNGWQNEFVRILFFETAKKLLQIDYDQVEPSRTGDRLIYQRFSLKSSPDAFVFRKQIWEQILCAQENCNCKESVINLLEAYPSRAEDASQGIIHDDAPAIIQLASKVLSEENVCDCILAEKLSLTLESVGCDTAEFKPFLTSKKLHLYHLLGGDWDYNKHCDEYQIEKKRRIIFSLDQAVNPIKVFFEMFEIYSLCLQNEDHESYEISGGMMIAIAHLLQDKTNIELVANTVIASCVIEGINYYLIVNKLFFNFDPDHVKSIIENAPPNTLDLWLFAFYHEYPEALITKNTVEEFYAYLESDYDRFLQIESCRSFDFLDKYQRIDGDVFIKSVRLAFAKKEYSPNIVDIYFKLLFYEHKYSPEVVIQQFGKNRHLLEEIYLYEVAHNRMVDSSGGFLKVLCSLNIEFTKKYVRMRAAQNHMVWHDESSRVQALYDCDEYFKIIDAMVLACKEVSATTYFSFSFLMEALIDVPECLTSKRDEWAKHFIISYNTDNDLMGCLFDEISKLPDDDEKILFIKLLIGCNSNPNLFNKIPLTPSSYSCSGSAIPLYSQWIDYLNKLLPLFHGFQYLPHKNRIKETIESLNERIRREEIEELLRG